MLLTLLPFVIRGVMGRKRRMKRSLTISSGVIFGSFSCMTRLTWANVGNRPALDDLRKIAFQILFFIYIGTKTDRFRHETGSTVPLFLGGLPAIFPHIEVLDGFRSVGEYLVIAAVYGNRYIRHKVYMNRLSMKSKQFVNGYQRI